MHVTKGKTSSAEDEDEDGETDVRGVRVEGELHARVGVPGRDLARRRGPAFLVHAAATPPSQKRVRVSTVRSACP